LLFAIAALGGPAATASVGSIESEIAEVETALAELESLARDWESRTTTQAEALAEQLSEVARLEGELRGARRGSETVGQLFDRSKELLSPAFDELEAAIQSASAPSQVPRYPTLSDSRRELFSTAEDPSPAANAMATDARHLTELRSRLGAETAKLVALEKRLRQESITRYGAYTTRLWRLRLAALEALPGTRRARLSSLTRERWNEIAFDFRALRLLIGYRVLQLRQFVADLPRLARDLFTAIAAGAVLARVALVALVWLQIYRRRAGALELLRQKAADAGRWRVVLELAKAAAPWATFLLGLVALRWAVGPEGRDLPLLAPLFFLAALYGGYRLGVDLLVAVLDSPSGSAAFELSPESRVRLERSVRRILRIAVPVLLVPVIYRYRLEGGVLYEALRQAAIWIILIAVVVELGRWRPELTTSYLALRSSGPWARLVRRTRDRPAEWLVAPLTFLLLAARGLYAIGQEIASGHAGTRAATAFLARRRIEREARKRGYVDVDLERLPTGLATALDERIRPEDFEALDGIPGLEEARHSLEDWRRGGRGGAFLVAGEEGTGKRAWLDRLSELELTSSRLILDRRLVEPADLFSWLQEVLLGENGDAASRAELVDRLLAGERRLVVLESSENLFLARVNGYRGLNELARLADETRERVYWLLSMESPAFKHLEATWRELSVARRVVELPQWTEKQIQRLLKRRLADAGHKVKFATLLGDFSGGEDAAARERAAERAYLSLLSDFADGNPGVALHYFLRSLVPIGEHQLSIQPFQRPVEDELVKMGDEAHFLLAAIVRHGGLTSEELPTVTAYPARLVAILLTRLVDLGAVAAEHGRYRVTTGWHPTVHKLLYRRNILVS
jgi:hypothetical protein